MKVHAIVLFLIACASGCWLLTPPTSSPPSFPHHFRILFWTPAKAPLRITLGELDKENSARFDLEYLACVSAPLVFSHLPHFASAPRLRKMLGLMVATSYTEI